MQELRASHKRIVGLKQTVKAVKSGNAKNVYVAEDADDFIKQSVIGACNDAKLRIIYVKSMKELGDACGIDIGASTAAIIKDQDV